MREVLGIIGENCQDVEKFMAGFRGYEGVLGFVDGMAEWGKKSRNL